MKRAYGFTIVELLIVIVVVAILAALSYVGYGTISNRAHDSAVQQDMQGLAQLLHVYKAEHGTYPAQVISSTLQPYGRLKVAKDSYDTTGIHGSGGAYSGRYNMLYCSQVGSLDQFGIIAKSRSGKVFQVTEDAGVRGYAGTEPSPSVSLCTDVVSSFAVTNQSWLYGNGNWVGWL